MNDSVGLQIQFLKEQITDLKVEQKEMQKDLKELVAFIHEAKGGKRYLFYAISISAALGTLISQIFNYIR